MTTKTASVTFLELEPTYLTETNVISEPVGATWSQIGLNCCIMSSALLALRVGQSRSRQIQPPLPTAATAWQRNLAWRVSVLALAMQILIALASPPYPLPGGDVTRHEFSSDLKFAGVANLLGTLLVFVPLIGGHLVAVGQMTNVPQSVRRGQILIAGHFAYFFLIGQRFNGFLVAFAFLLSGYLATRQRLDLRSIDVRWRVVAASAMLTIAFISYLDITSRGIAETAGPGIAAAEYRIFALQGSVAYTAESLSAGGVRGGTELLTEGMDATRVAYMPPRLASQYKDRGINLAGSLPGNSVLSLGRAGAVLVMVGFGLLLGAVARLLAKLLRAGELVAAAAAAHLLLWTSSSYAQGSFAPLLEPKALLAASAIALWSLRPRPHTTHRTLAAPAFT